MGHVFSPVCLGNELQMGWMDTARVNGLTDFGGFRHSARLFTLCRHGLAFALSNTDLALCAAFYCLVLLSMVTSAFATLRQIETGKLKHKAKSLLLPEWFVKVGNHGILVVDLLVPNYFFYECDFWDYVLGNCS